MDLYALNSLIPKHPMYWNTEDVQTWLTFIGCQVYYPAFQKQCFDGSLWDELTEEVLKKDFGIKEHLPIVKMLRWRDLLKTTFNNVQFQPMSVTQMPMRQSYVQAMPQAQVVHQQPQVVHQQPQVVHQQPQVVVNNSPHKNVVPKHNGGNVTPQHNGGNVAPQKN